MEIRARALHAAVLAAVALAAVATGLLLPAPGGSDVTAMPEIATFCVYYHDAAHTQYAGSCFFSCTGNSCSGQITQYSVCNDVKRCYTPDECSEAPWCDPRYENCCPWV